MEDRWSSSRNASSSTSRTAHLFGRPSVLTLNKVENAATTDLNSFTYRLMGNYPNATPTQQSPTQKHIEIRLADQCPKDNCELDQLHFSVLVLQMLPITNPSNSSSSSFYLIHVNQPSTTTNPITFNHKQVENATGAMQSNVTFRLQPSKWSSLFGVHPLTGVLTIKSSDDLT
uniref:MSP domain-containing protein n=1 Tax=Ditylenchus dipsaci TaxID=166011 RepID=A0A915DPG8_9BILA